MQEEKDGCRSRRKARKKGNIRKDGLPRKRWIEKANGESYRSGWIKQDLDKER